MSGTLRVLPLGGLGEIGKNMTVVEYDGKIVVVDTGLRFPTADMLGIDLVLPDFSYLLERAQDIEGIILTHGHEDHVGALPWVMRQIGADPPPVYGGNLTIAMVRSKLDEHRLKDVQLEVLEPGDELELGPFIAEMVHMTHSIPDSAGVALTCELGTTFITGDYKFDQTPVDGKPADVSRLAELGADGLLLLLRRLDQRRPPGLLAQRVGRSARTSRRSSPAARAASSSRPSPRTSTASSRSSTPPRRSTARSSSSAARCARTSTSAARSATSTSPRGCSSSPARSTSSPTTSS